MRVMKKILMVIFLGLFVFTACQNTEDVSITNPEDVKEETVDKTEVAAASVLNDVPANTVRVEKHDMNILVDPRVELMNILIHLSDFELWSPSVSQYMTDVEEYFRPFAEHKAVKATKEKLESGFVHSTNGFIIHYSMDEQLALSYKMPKDIEKFSNNNDTYVSQLNDFLIETNFLKFYDDHKSFYSDKVNAYADTIDESPVKYLADYFGEAKGEYNVVLTFLQNGGNYGPRITDNDGNQVVYAMLAAKDYAFDYARNKGTFIHEFSHSYINPITERYLEEVNATSSLMDEIESYMRNQAYPTWQIAVNEHIVRAVTARIIKQTEGHRAYQQEIARNLDLGFVYIDELVELLIKFENDKTTYPIIESFYPEIMKLFKSLQQQTVEENRGPFTGRIDAIYRNHSKLYKVIIPEEDKEIEDYVKSVWNKDFEMKLNGYIRILTDKEALAKDLSKSNIIVYGTIENNKFLKEIEEVLPFSVGNDKIAIGNITYEGTDLELITGIPNPQNNKLGLVIYTAQRAKSLIDINYNWHGSQQFHIFDKDGEVVAEGYYPNKQFDELTQAVLSNNLDAVNQWLDLGKEINVPDSNGTYALEQVLVMNNCEMAELLLEAGADSSLLNNEGVSIYDRAMEANSKKLKELFKNYVK